MPVLGYIDPASGMLVLQAMVASSLGAIAFFRRSIWRVVAGMMPGRKG